MAEGMVYRVITANENIVVYGALWCGDCWRAKKFLDERHIPYEWIDVDKDPEAAGYVQRINKGMRSIPTIIFPDGSVLVEPSHAELAKKFGLQAERWLLLE